MTSTRKTRTAADFAAAVKLGAIDPNAPMLSDDELAEITAEMAENGQGAPALPAGTVVLPANAHQCGIPGCRHGADHGPAQPDRQVKLACDRCGMVVRTTTRWLAKRGAPTCADGGTFVTAQRRTYTRKVAA